MESNYKFEIHFDGQEMETEQMATDIVEAIFSVIAIYKSSFNIDLDVSNFILIDGNI